jgi:serpin B
MYDRFHKLVLTALAVALALAGCAPQGPSVVRAAEQRSELPRVNPDASAETHVPELVEGNTEFALDLYRALFNAQENQFSSPYSISLALAMTLAGASGETAAAMLSTLHLPAQDVLHAAFNALDTALRSRGLTVKEEERFRLNIVNALWGQQGQHFQSAFLDTLAQYYNAGLRTLDFEKATEAARQAINSWVEEQTEGRIEDLLPEGSLEPSTALVLTNAIYFNASWQFPFRPEATQDGPFRLLDGGEVTVPMMYQNVELRYVDGSGYQAIELPYTGGELSMLVILPDQGAFAGWAGGLDPALLNEVVSGLATRQVALTLPRFSFTSEVALKEALQRLGMAQAFSDSADFRGMTGQRELFIDEVFHKAFVAVDEEGTEAAAATAVVMGRVSMPLDPIAMVVDSPFLFLIRDVATGTLLFLGHVVNPA